MIFVILLSIAFFTSWLGLPDFSAELSAPFQKFCTKMSPGPSEFTDMYRAMVCGVTPGQSQYTWAFRATGLYHLIVVSGAHLGFLLALFEWHRGLQAARPAIFPVLFIYSLMSGLNPPVARALMSFALQHLSQGYKLSWSNSNTVLVSGLLCLCVFPAWWTSLSFLMSWLAALALSHAQNNIAKAIACYVLLLIPMSAIQWTHPASILLNAAVGAPLGFVLLPVSIIPFFVPPILPVTDVIWFAVSELALFLAEPLEPLDPLLKWPLWGAWLAVGAIHIAVSRSAVRRRRREWFA